MTDKFQNKYRIASSRLQNWDYRWNAAYFVTICTKNRDHYFGEISNGEMNLSGIGIIADIMWYEIKNHSKNVELDAFVVMPNHIHGIIIINKPNGLVADVANGSDGDVANGSVADVANGSDVETLHATSLPPTPPTPPTKNQTMANISPKRGSLSTILRSYKSAVTNHTNRLGFQFAWQSRFHDHIIRDEDEFQRIRNYIINNPKNWTDDRFNK
jgi:hypothetical protein